ncbi:MAG TPA: tetratricopeptide repeat protein, partial [Chloroflexia bacterium]|nr:tetratricopeptide repeat protein [Chloroflexia bacterium]
RAHIDASLRLWRELGDREGMAMPLHNLGHVVLRLGDADRAGALFEESLALFQALDVPVGVALCLAGLAGVAGAQGDAGRGAKLLGAAAAALDAIGAHLQAADLTDYEHSEAVLRAALGEAAFAAAFATGRTLPPDEALA